jgi:hypothetical protein
MGTEDFPQTSVSALVEQVLVLLTDQCVEFLFRGADKAASCL